MSKPTEDQIKQLDELFQREDLTYFEQGDLLLAIDPDDEVLDQLANQFDRAVSTLRERMKVSKLFPPERRSTKVAWTIYREASRIKKAEDRFAIMDSRSEWTLGAIESAVTNQLQKDAELNQGKIKKQPVKRGGFKLDDIKGSSTLEGDVLTVELRGDHSRISDGKILSLSEGRVLVAFTIS